jgi:2'-5' RNA ligase
MGFTLTRLEAGRPFALIGFVPGALGEYLNLMRRQLVPGCTFKSHVTLLPPQVLSESAADLSKSLHYKLLAVQALEIGLGEVEAFPATGVVFLGIAAGRSVLEQVHGLLAQDKFSGEEAFPFHPHVTLAQDFAPLQPAGLMEHARSLWKSWKGERNFVLDRVSFVRGVDPGAWETVSEHDLSRARLPRTV